MSLTSAEEIDALTRLAESLADAAAEITLAHFRSDALALDNKHDGDGFDPVTVADHAAEAAIREILTNARPKDGFFGEEGAQASGSSGLTWIVDPIDGTRAYISGLPVWGTLIALDDGEKGRIGLIDQPYTRERFIGVIAENSKRSWMTHNGVCRELHTRHGIGLNDAILFTTDPDLFDEREADAFQAVRARARLTRYGTDCYAYALLAMGQIDLVIEAGLHAYDIAAHVPIIEAAGGRVTDWQGGDCRWGGRVIAAGSQALLDEVLEVLSCTRDTRC